MNPGPTVYERGPSARDDAHLRATTPDATPSPELTDQALRVLTSAREGDPKAVAEAVRLAESVLREQLAATKGRKAGAG